MNFLKQKHPVKEKFCKKCKKYKASYTFIEKKENKINENRFFPFCQFFLKKYKILPDFIYPAQKPYQNIKKIKFDKDLMLSIMRVTSKKNKETKNKKVATKRILNSKEREYHERNEN